MPASAASAANPLEQTLRLPEGDAPLETVEIPAASIWRRSYVLEGHERVAWDIRVLDGYDVVFSTRVACSGLQRGSDRSRELTERERAGEFEGFLDLGREHAGWLQALGAAALHGPPSGPSPNSASSIGASPAAATPADAPAAVLVMELDNVYSYFTPKRVQLSISKRRGAALKPKSFQEVLKAGEPGARWQVALRLLGRMREADVRPDLEAYRASLGACRDDRRWAEALSLLEEMRVAGVEPDAGAYEAAIGACEGCGQADRALELLDGLDAALIGSGGFSARLPDGAGEDDVVFVRGALREAIARCPTGAHDVLKHLLAAQEELERFVGDDAHVRGGRT